jgi:hypothetical protein
MTDHELHKKITNAILSHGTYHRASLATKITTSTLYNWKKRLPYQCRDLLKILDAAGLTVQIVPNGKMDSVIDR